MDIELERHISRADAPNSFDDIKLIVPLYRPFMYIKQLFSPILIVNDRQYQLPTNISRTIATQNIASFVSAGPASSKPFQRWQPIE